MEQRQYEIYGRPEIGEHDAGRELECVCIVPGGIAIRISDQAGNVDCLRYVQQEE